MLGIIGGSGLYALEGLQNSEKKKIETPFGSPSDNIVIGEFGNAADSKKVAFLPRHGKAHSILPGEINFRANIWAMKSLGVRHLISISAVGSLDEDIHPGELAIPGQYSDFTKGKRGATFFGNGMVGHISTANPSCAQLADEINRVSKENNVYIHRHKAYACVEGPRLGTRSESFFLKNTQHNLVGMTNVPEVFLAREAQMCYATIAVVTDYDCWREDPEDHANVEKIMALYFENIATIKKILKKVITKGHLPDKCSCRQSLQGAVMTPENLISEDNAKLLEFLRR